MISESLPRLRERKQLKRESKKVQTRCKASMFLGTETEDARQKALG